MDEKNINFEKLTLCDNFFINCNITYLQCAINYYAANNEDFLLLYLADCELKYANDIDECHARNDKDPAIHNNDPFYYQPLKLYNSKKDILFNDKSFNDLLRFLKTSFNVKIKMIFSPLTKEYLSGILQDGFKNNELFIINVDLYHCSYLPQYYTYCSYLPLYYNNIHSRHGLLIKGFDAGNNMVEVIDTLLLKPYKLNFDELAAGFNTGSFINSIIKINGNNFSNSIDYAEKQNAFFKTSSGITFIDDIITDLEEYLYKNTSSKYDKGFHFARYYNAIKYQLLPYLTMRFHLSAANSLTTKDSLRSWESIAGILWTLIPRKNNCLCKSLLTEDYNANSLFKMLDKLRVLEENIVRDMKNQNK